MTREDHRACMGGKSSDQFLDIGKDGWGAGDEGMRGRRKKIILHIQHQQGGVLRIEFHARMAGAQGGKRIQHGAGCLPDGLGGEISFAFHKRGLYRKPRLFEDEFRLAGNAHEN